MGWYWLIVWFDAGFGTLKVPMHLGLYLLALCDPYQIMGAMWVYWSPRWPPCLYSQYPVAPRKRSPDAHVWVRPRPHTRRECEPSFPPLLHTFYTEDCPAALVREGVFSGCYVQQEGQLQPWGIQNNKYQVSHKYSCSSWWWTWRGPKHVEVIIKLTKCTENKLCTTLVSFTRTFVLLYHSLVIMVRTVVINS
jgi:hypothetical protein